MGLLLSPFQGLLYVFQEIANRAEDELYDDDAIMAELTELYKKLEAGALSEEDFTEREAGLMERLEAIEEHKNARRAS